MKYAIPLVRSAAITAVAFALAFDAFAQTTTYFNTAQGDWTASGNWTGGAVPVSGDTAVIGSGAASAARNAIVNINSGDAANAAAFSIGKDLTTTGKLTINGGTLNLLATPPSYLGYQGNGTMEIVNGAVVSGGSITLGSAASGEGTLLISNSGGAPGKLQFPSNNIIVGSAGKGTLIVSGGIIDSPNYGITAANVVNGVSEIVVENSANVRVKNLALASYGGNTSSKLTVNGNSTVDNLGTLYAGLSTGSTSEIDFQSGKWIQRDKMVVGSKNGATGRMTISGGELMPMNEMQVGSEAGSIGFMTITNSVELWTNGLAKMYVGNYSTGSLDMIDSSLTMQGMLYVGNYNGSIGAAKFINSALTNKSGAIFGNVAGSASKAVQIGGTWAVPSILTLGASGEGRYVGTNAILTANQIDIASKGTTGTSKGSAILNGTNRVMRISYKLIVGTDGPGAITNNIDSLAGGIDITPTTATALTVGAKGNIHLAYKKDPTELGMFWGMRWAGNHVDALNALRNSTPAQLTWDLSGINEFYHPDMGIHYDGTYTYVGIPVERFAPPLGTMVIVR